MNLKIKNLYRLALTGTLAVSIPLWGQSDFDLPPPPDFSNQLPPASPFSNRGGQSGNTSDSNSTAGGGNGSSSANQVEILTKQKKQKFSAAPIEDINDKNFPETIESFDFPNAELSDVVKAISELTGKNFLIDPGVKGRITIIAPSQITVAEAYKAFLSALAINGYAVVPSGKFLKVRSARNAQRDGIETYTGSYYPNSDQMITRVINLKHISAEAINRDLRLLHSKDGEMSPYPATNSIIISDYGSNIDRIMKIISQLDVPGFDDILEVIPIKFAKAKDIAELVSKIVNKGDKNQGGAGGSFSSGVPRFTRAASAQTQSGNSSPYFMVIPDERSNSLVVVGNKSGIVRVKKLLTRLDYQIRPEESGGVYVYYLKYGDAEKIAQTLSIVTKDQSPKASESKSSLIISPTAGVQVGSQSLFGGDVKINADKNTNSLVIMANKQDYDVVLNLLNKIDIPRDQVYVESIIMEMKLTDSLDWQIGYFKFDPSGSGGKAGFNGMKPETLAGLLTPQGGSGAILGFGSSDKVTITPPGSTTQTTIASLIGFINFLKTHSNANILSTPQILAMDNQEAEIEVGDKVITGQTVSTTSVGQTQAAPIFEDATIKLKIKPFISTSTDSVRMELSSSVKQLSTAKTPSGLVSVSQPLATRSIKTNIVVPNKDTAVLGGLMKEDDIETIQKVPLLGDIPVIGWLFKSRGISKEKTNMLVFLTPSIIRNNKDSRMILGKKLDERINFIKSMGGRDPYGAKVDQINQSVKSSALSNELPFESGDGDGDGNENGDQPAIEQNNEENRDNGTDEGGSDLNQNVNPLNGQINNDNPSTETQDSAKAEDVFFEETDLEQEGGNPSQIDSNDANQNNGADDFNNSTNSNDAVVE